MCFSLMGFVNHDADFDAVRRISLLHQQYYEKLDQFDHEPPYHFPRLEGTIGFVLHPGCDCASAVGQGDPDQQELLDYVAWLRDLHSCPGIRFLSLAKVWDPTDAFSQQKSAWADEVDAKFLADMKEDTPYQLNFRDRSVA